MKDTKELTKTDVESLRGELFHMILFSLAWALIGEYVLDFRDYAIGVGLILAAVVGLALYSIKLYQLEDDLPGVVAFENRRVLKQDRLYALIFVFEAVAIFVTWGLILKLGHDNWLICCFALIAGLHFLPLAWVIHQRSYYVLGVWITALSVAGYLLLSSARVADYYANTLVAYGCAAGAAIDGIGIVLKTRKALRR
jgi:hypothetical protein